MSVSKSRMGRMSRIVLAAAIVGAFGLAGAAGAAQNVNPAVEDPAGSVVPVWDGDWKAKVDFGSQQVCELAGSAGQALRLWDRDEWECIDGTLWVRE